MVKEFLSQKRIAFEERDVSRDRNAAQELISKTGQTGVPVTIIDGQIVVGFDRNRLEQVINQSQQPPFGVSVADASQITARQGSGITLGAYVGKVKSGSIAERIGLVPDDIIIELNRKRITNSSDLEHMLASLSRGSHLSLVFLRGNKTMTAGGTF